MAVQVTSAGQNNIGEKKASVVRNSDGIPYVLVWQYDSVANELVEIWKGNGTTPTSFSEQDSGSGPSGAKYEAPSCCIDSNDLIHIAYWDEDSKNGGIRYVQFRADGINDDFQNDTLVVGIGDGSGSYDRTSIAVDSNDVPHIVFVDSGANMGTGYSTVFYVDKVGGSWNSAYEIEGYSSEKNCFAPTIAIDKDDKPVVCYRNSTDSDLTAVIGDANEATNFTLFDVAGGFSGDSTIAVDSSGNHHVAYETTASYIREHSYGDNWNTWQDRETVHASDDGGIHLAIDGTTRYVFICDVSNWIRYYTDSSGSWALGDTLEDAYAFSFMGVRWAYNVDNDSSGTDRGGGSGRLEIDYVFDETPRDDIFFNSLSLVSAAIASKRLLVGHGR